MDGGQLYEKIKVNYSLLRTKKSSSRIRFEKWSKTYSKDWDKCIIKISCIVIWSHKTSCSDQRASLIAWSVTMALLSSQILRNICSCDVEHQAMSLLKLLILRIWRLSTSLFVTFSVLASYFIFYYSARASSKERHTTKYFQKTDFAILHFKGHNMNMSIKILWIYWKKCLKSLLRNESVPKKPWNMLISRNKSIKGTKMLYRFWIRFKLWENHLY